MNRDRKSAIRIQAYLAAALVVETFLDTADPFYLDPQEHQEMRHQMDLIAARLRRKANQATQR